MLAINRQRLLGSIQEHESVSFVCQGSQTPVIICRQLDGPFCRLDSFCPLARENPVKGQITTDQMKLTFGGFREILLFNQRLKERNCFAIELGLLLMSVERFLSFRLSKLIQ